MPIKLSIPAGAETAMAQETAKWKVMLGPSKKIPEPPPERLQHIAAEEISVLLAKFNEGDKVSLNVQAGFKLKEKLDNGDPLTPQEYANIWALAAEARGADGKGAVGGVADKTSKFFVDKPGIRQQELGRLNRLQSEIEMHLTGERFWGADPRNWMRNRLVFGRLQSAGTGFGRLFLGKEGVNDRARAAFQMDSDLAAARTKVTVEMFGSGQSFSGLNADQKRIAQSQALEQVTISIGSNHIQDLLKDVGIQAFDKSKIENAEASTNMRERVVGQIARELPKLRAKAITEGSKIRGMRSCTEIKAALGIDVTDPDQVNAISNNQIAEAVIKYYDVSGADADNLRKNPDLAVENYLSHDTTGFGVFVGDLIQTSMRSYEVQSTAPTVTTPDKLKKATVEVNNTLRAALNSKDAAFLLLMHIKNAPYTSADSETVLVNKLRITRTKAKEYIRDAVTQGYILKANPAAPLTINLATLADWATPEMCAETMRRGVTGINPTALRTRIDASLIGTIVNASDRKIEVDRRMADINEANKLYTSTDKSVQVTSASKWDKKQMVLISLMSGVGMRDRFAAALDTPGKQAMTDLLE